MEKEKILEDIHKELKVKSIEKLTDQLMLKDKEIFTLKKQLEILRDQLYNSKNNTATPLNEMVRPCPSINSPK